MKGNALDPKGLIAESYRIEGISAEQCRSIFVDWALSMPADRTDGTSILKTLKNLQVIKRPCFVRTVLI